MDEDQESACSSDGDAFHEGDAFRSGSGDCDVRSPACERCSVLWGRAGSASWGGNGSGAAVAGPKPSRLDDDLAQRQIRKMVNSVQYRLLYTPRPYSSMAADLMESYNRIGSLFEMHWTWLEPLAACAGEKDALLQHARGRRMPGCTVWCGGGGTARPSRERTGSQAAGPPTLECRVVSPSRGMPAAGPAGRPAGVPAGEPAAAHWAGPAGPGSSRSRPATPRVFDAPPAPCGSPVYFAYFVPPFTLRSQRCIVDPAARHIARRGLRQRLEPSGFCLKEERLRAENPTDLFESRVARAAENESNIAGAAKAATAARAATAAISLGGCAGSGEALRRRSGVGRLVMASRRCSGRVRPPFAGAARARYSKTGEHGPKGGVWGGDRALRRRATGDVGAASGVGAGGVDGALAGGASTSPFGTGERGSGCAEPLQCYEGGNCAGNSPALFSRAASDSRLGKGAVGSGESTAASSAPPSCASVAAAAGGDGGGGGPAGTFGNAPGGASGAPGGASGAFAPPLAHFVQFQLRQLSLDHGLRLPSDLFLLLLGRPGARVRRFLAAPPVARRAPLAAPSPTFRRLLKADGDLHPLLVESTPGHLVPRRAPRPAAPEAPWAAATSQTPPPGRRFAHPAAARAGAAVPAPPPPGAAFAPAAAATAAGDVSSPPAAITHPPVITLIVLLPGKDMVAFDWLPFTSRFYNQVIEREMAKAAAGAGGAPPPPAAPGAASASASPAASGRPFASLLLSSFNEDSDTALAAVPAPRDAADCCGSPQLPPAPTAEFESLDFESGPPRARGSVRSLSDSSTTASSSTLGQGGSKLLGCEERSREAAAAAAAAAAVAAVAGTAAPSSAPTEPAAPSAATGAGAFSAPPAAAEPSALSAAAAPSAPPAAAESSALSAATAPSVLSAAAESSAFSAAAAPSALSAAAAPAALSAAAAPAAPPAPAAPRRSVVSSYYPANLDLSLPLPTWLLKYICPSSSPGSLTGSCECVNCKFLFGGGGGGAEGLEALPTAPAAGAAGAGGDAISASAGQGRAPGAAGGGDGGGEAGAASGADGLAREIAAAAGLARGATAAAANAVGAAVAGAGGASAAAASATAAAASATAAGSASSAGSAGVFCDGVSSLPNVFLGPLLSCAMRAAFLLPEYPGNGFCGGVPGVAMTTECVMAVIMRAVADLRRRCRGVGGAAPRVDVRLLGYSLGAAVALQAANALADLSALPPGVSFSGLTLVAPFTSVVDWVAAFLGVPTPMKRITKALLSSLIDPHIHWDNVAAMQALCRKVANKPSGAQGGGGRAAGAVGAGAAFGIHVVHGSADQTVPSAMGRELAAVAEAALCPAGFRALFPKSAVLKAAEFALADGEGAPCARREETAYVKWTEVEGEDHQSILLNAAPQKVIFDALQAGAEVVAFPAEAPPRRR